MRIGQQQMGDRHPLYPHQSGRIVPIHDPGFWHCPHLPMPAERPEPVSSVLDAWYSAFPASVPRETATLLRFRQRLLLFLFGQRFVKFSSGMCPAAHHPDVLRHLVIPLVSVYVQPAGEVLEESHRKLRLPAALVLAQHNGILSAAAGRVEPHVGRACWAPIW